MRTNDVMRAETSGMTRQARAELFAATVTEQLNEYRRGDKMHARRKSQEYKEIPEVLDALEHLLRNTIEADRKKANAFWTQVRSFFSNPFTFNKRKREFDAKVRALVMNAWMVMRQVRAYSNPALENLDKPDLLRRVQEQWRNVHGTTEKAVEPLDSLRSIDGWSGMAYNDYRKMAEVQVAACSEFTQFSRALAIAFGRTSDLNKAVLSSLCSVLQQVKRFDRVKAGSMEFYVDTANLMRALVECLHTFPRVLMMSQEASTDLTRKLEGFQTSAVVLEMGDEWPRGTSKFGVEAGNTARGIDFSLDMPEVPTGKPTSGGGIRR